MRTTLNLFLTPAYPGYGPPTTLSMELAPQNKKGGKGMVLTTNIS